VYGDGFRALLRSVALALLSSSVRNTDTTEPPRGGSESLQECSYPLTAAVAQLDNKWLMLLERCVGCLNGLNDLANLSMVMNPKSWLAYCLPEGVVMGQLGRAAVEYLQDHPAKLQSPASALIIAALREAFPCPAHGRAKLGEPITAGCL